MDTSAAQRLHAVITDLHVDAEVSNDRLRTVDKTIAIVGDHHVNDLECHTSNTASCLTSTYIHLIQLGAEFLRLAIGSNDRQTQAGEQFRTLDRTRDTERWIHSTVVPR